MLKTLTRIFTTRVCPTCSKAVHLSKLDAHLRRHAAGLSQYVRNVARGPLSGPSQGVATLYKRSKDGAGHSSAPKIVWRLDVNDELRRVVEAKLAELNADVPTFTTRPVPDSEPSGSFVGETIAINPANPIYHPALTPCCSAYDEMGSYERCRDAPCAPFACRPRLQTDGRSSRRTKVNPPKQRRPLNAKDSR